MKTYTTTTTTTTTDIFSSNIMDMQLIDNKVVVSTMNNREEEVNLKPIKTKRNINPMLEQEEELLSPPSRMFHEPNYNINIVAIMGWKAQNGPNLDLIKHTLTNTVLNHPHFSSVQVMDSKDRGKVRWVASQVNLDNHIIVKKLEPNMDLLSQDKAIDDYVSNLSRTPIDKSKPLWELHILMFNSSTPLFSSSDGVSIFRIHHSLGDGISLVSILLSCTRKTSDPNSPPTVNIPNIRKLSTSTGGINLNHGGRGRGVGGLFCNMWCYFITLWLKIKLFCHSIVDLMMFVLTAMFLKDTETPIRSSKIYKNNDPAYRRFVLRTVNLDDIKLVKNATNATVNDVVLGVIQAGLSRYIDRRYGEDEVVGKTNMTPGRIKCRATVLINLRPLLGTNATDEINEKNIPIVKQGNCFGFVLLPLKVSGVDNPLDHVRNAKATMDRKKQSLEVIWTSYILDLLLKLFGYKAATALAERVPLQTTLAFSNVMGPTEEISFCDHPMTFMAATCYGQPVPLMVHVVTYTNKLTFAISVDERTIPDPYEFAQDFVESLQDMKKVVLGTKTH